MRNPRNAPAMEMAREDEHHHRRPKTSHSSETSDHSLLISTLPPEIVIEILLKLPVESLLRCKAVCKSWHSFISDPCFIKSHLMLSTNNKHYARHRLFFRTTGLNFMTCPLYDVLRDESVNAVDFDYPLKHTGKSIWRVSSCNGLLCIALHYGDIFFLWNPSTRVWNRLPCSGCNFRKMYGVFWSIGFGYDGSTDDYKVVGIAGGKMGTKYDMKVWLYSLKTGNWKKIDDFPHGFPSFDPGEFTNGALHWAASPDFPGEASSGSTHSWRIVSLDLANETYGEVLQPLYNEGLKELTLGTLGEWLCVLCTYGENRSDLWVMKVYGSRDSWTKLVSIPYHLDRHSVPLCMLNNGIILLQLSSEWVLYDSKNGSFSKIRNSDKCSGAYMYVESLVSPYAQWRVRNRRRLGAHT